MSNKLGINEAARLAEKLWDTFRSLNYFRGVCRKTYGQLGIPIQNVWLAMAARAHSEIRSMMSCRCKPKRKIPGARPKGRQPDKHGMR